MTALASCGGKSKLDTFKDVCDGKPVESAAAYAPGGISPVLPFEKREDRIRYAKPDLPKEWSSFADYAKYQLVACVMIVDRTHAGDCTYEGGAHIALYDATLELSVREAKTAKVLATKPLTLRHDTSNTITHGCPMMASADEGGVVYPRYAETLAAFLAPYVNHTPAR